MLSAAVVVAVRPRARASTAARARRGPARRDRPLRRRSRAARVAARIAALPDVAGYSTPARGHQRRDRRRRAPARRRGRRGGRSRAAPRLRGRRRPRPARDAAREVLVERAFADAWGLRLGEHGLRARARPADASSASSRRPTTSASRSRSRASTSRAPAIDARFGAERDPQVNLAEIWLRDPRYLNEVLVQARATSFGLRDIRFATRVRRPRAARPGSRDRDRPARRAVADRARSPPA